MDPGDGQRNNLRQPLRSSLPHSSVLSERRLCLRMRESSGVDRSRNGQGAPYIAGVVDFHRQGRSHPWSAGHMSAGHIAVQEREGCR
jgi:hypothetical protein